MKERLSRAEKDSLGETERQKARVPDRFLGKKERNVGPTRSTHNEPHSRYGRVTRESTALGASKRRLAEYRCRGRAAAPKLSLVDKGEPMSRGADGLAASSRALSSLPRLLSLS